LIGRGEPVVSREITRHSGRRAFRGVAAQVADRGSANRDGPASRPHLAVLPRMMLGGRRSGRVRSRPTVTVMAPTPAGRTPGSARDRDWHGEEPRPRGRCRDGGYLPLSWFECLGFSEGTGLPGVATPGGDACVPRSAQDRRTAESLITPTAERIPPRNSDIDRAHLASNQGN
jgi:hypothetical protein